MSNILELATEDILQYKFYPVVSGLVNLKVRASNDAHIALTTGPQEAEPMIEIILGGWKNTKSVIRKNKNQPEVVELNTQGILSGKKYREFWIRWDCGVISVGYKGESIPFLSWIDSEPFAIGYVGVCTGWGATGSWKIDDGDEFDTPDNLEYSFRPVVQGFLDFEFRGPSNCYLCLTTAPAEVEPIYEFVLGGWKNTKSVIRYNKQEPEKVAVDTTRLLDPSEYKKFLLEWRYGRVAVSDKLSGAVLMEWTHDTPFTITHFGVSTGWGVSGNWRFKVIPTSVVEQ